MLVKSTPGVNFINILCARFFLVWALRLFGTKILYEKRVRKMLMKLTADQQEILFSALIGRSED